MPKSEPTPASLRKLPAPKRSEDVDERLIGSDVKRRMYADQHGKCIYCECLLNGDYGHVEHYRPKGGYTLPGSKVVHKPGYYWLAYNWKNLLLSCSRCNTSYKQNQFPLADESVRDTRHRCIRKEEPLLINPALEDPMRHMEYRRHLLVPRVRDGVPDRRGAATIQALKLNERPELVRRRMRVWEAHRHWEHIQVLATIMLFRSNYDNSAELMLRTASRELHAMEAPDAEFSGMFQYPGDS